MPGSFERKLPGTTRFGSETELTLDGVVMGGRVVILSEAKDLSVDSPREILALWAQVTSFRMTERWVLDFKWGTFLMQLIRIKETLVDSGDARRR